MNEDPNMEPLEQAGYSDALIHFVMQMLSRDPTQRPEPFALLKDSKLWSDFDMTNSEQLAAEAFARLPKGGADRERITKCDQEQNMTLIKYGGRDVTQLSEVTPGSGRNLIDLADLSGCSSPSTTSGPPSPSTGCSCPSTASGSSSSSSVLGESGWAFCVMAQVKMLKAKASSRTASIQALLR
jgi:serine/threonine protein kinase